MRRMRNVVSVTLSAVGAAGALIIAPDAIQAIPAATAEPCPQVEVIFARGAKEPPGTGQVGDAFVNAIRARTDKSIDFYPVNYSADIDFVPGANDMSGRIQYMAANCPNTRLVLGGYSLGAAVTDIVVAVPSAIFGYTNPLPLGMDEHVAAVALFGNGTQKVLGPVADINPLYGSKTIDICTDGDPICNDNLDPETWADNWSAHLQAAYIDSGLVNQAADFVVARI